MLKEKHHSASAYPLKSALDAQSDESSMTKGESAMSNFHNRLSAIIREMGNYRATTEAVISRFDGSILPQSVDLDGLTVGLEGGGIAAVIEKDLEVIDLLCSDLRDRLFVINKIA